MRGATYIATCVLGAFALSACGSSHPIILNTERVETAIQNSFVAKRGIRSIVSCPSGIIQKKGVVFNCTATDINGKHLKYSFVVTELDSHGHVHYAGR